MNLRAIAAGVGGILAWLALFMIVGIAFGLVWPDYRAAARLFFDSQDFSLFTVPMMLTNFVLFAIAGVATGWLVTVTGKSRRAGQVVAAILFAYAIANHYYWLWGILPDWYNIVVPWIMGGSTLFGAVGLNLRRKV